MWIIFALICIGVGLVLYSGIQADLPDELSFMKSKPSGAVVENTTTVDSAPLPVTTSAAWNILAMGEMVEVSRDFSNDIHGNGGVRYDRPVFYLTCYKQGLYARIDTRLHTKGEKSAEVDWQGIHQTWVHGSGQNIFSPDALAIVKSIKGRNTAQVSLTFDEAPKQTFELKLDGMTWALQQLKRSCAIPE